MGIGVSIFMLAVGAILKFATDFEFSGAAIDAPGVRFSFDLDALGVILMIVGGLGLLVALVIHRVGGDAGGARRTYL